MWDSGGVSRHMLWTSRTAYLANLILGILIALAFEVYLVLEAGTPAWYQPVQIAGSVWLYSEFLVLLTNKKRRALHYFMAGTVVIRTGVAKPS
jgi:hypothetical protein